MDRYRGERFGEGGGRHSRPPSRWSDGPNGDQYQRYQDAREGSGGDSFSGGRHHPYRRGSFDHAPARGGGGRNSGFRSGSGGGFGSFGDHPTPMGATRHGSGGGFSAPDRGTSPSTDNLDGSKFAKLFVGSVPRTATEQEIRPLFEDHGRVIEVALIKDKRTGQQQGCCFIKYATQEEADMAIRALHNQVTLPGGVGPIQVRYADGERERLGAVEHKLFVGSLNKQATEKEVEEIFSQYGRVEDVYLMRDELKQSRGCGFVKFSSREMAIAAINGLNGTYLMRGCDQPLIVRFADPKRPRPGESRGGPSFGGPGFNTRPQGPSGGRFTGEPMVGQPHDGWHFDQDSVAPSPPHGFNSQFQPKGGYLVAHSASGFSPGNIQPVGQQTSPQQKQLSPQHFPTAMHLQQSQQNMTPYLQAAGHVSHLQTSLSSGFPSVSHPPPSNQLLSLGAKLPSSQPLLPQGTPSTLQSSLNLQGALASVNQQQLPGLSISQLLQQPSQQVPSQLLLHQQGQSLQPGLQSSQQTLSQLQQQLQLNQSSSLTQQQLQLLQPSGLGLQQNTHNVKEQLISTTTVAVAAVVPSAASPTHLTGQGTISFTCSWTEHTSPQGFKYYYNSVTKESRWEKPDELTLFEQQQKLQQQQQQQQKYVIHSQSQMPTTSENQPSQQLSQMQQVQGQIQLRQQGQLQQLHPFSYQGSGLATNQNIQELSYSQLQGAGSGFESVHMQKGPQAASQDWMWRNKTGGV